MGILLLKYKKYMKYKKFIIESYRAITKPIVVDIEKYSLMPIIGVNECGKTTILQAIFAFDCYNDKLNQRGKHLRDVINLYSTSDTAPIISAEIGINSKELSTFINLYKTEIEKKQMKQKKLANDVETAEETPSVESETTEDNNETTNDSEDNNWDLNEPTINKLNEYDYYVKSKKIETIVITRNLKTRKYNIEDDNFSNSNINHQICKKIIQKLPYILYFDDFRDSVDDKIEIKRGEDSSSWLDIIEELFKKTDPNFSVYDLKDKEKRQRKGIISKVKRHLNKTLTREWENFKLDDKDALTISIEYKDDDNDREFINLDVIETDTKGDEHFFFVRDRSKGFYWFFNFVMKLEFNPKSLDFEGQEAIYLLDEPGSYLHAIAQSKLCNKLKKLSIKNKVLYCTHSHYLLDPELIPLNNIKIADKDGGGNISITNIYDYHGNHTKRSAFQPVLDALQIKPFILDYSNNKIVITEGIYDYYAFNMFKQSSSINFLPSVNADSIKYYISLMIAWGIDYRALWDNDSEGEEHYRDAQKKFGPHEAKKRFRLLPPKSPRARKTILQDLFEGKDIRLIKKEIGLPNNASFNKTILTLYYSEKKSNIIKILSQETKDRFSITIDSLNYK